MRKAIILISTFLVTACCGLTNEGPATETAAAAPESNVSDSGIKTKNIEGFSGVMAESYQDSQERWVPEERPNEDAPNVFIFLLDDVGFAQIESFGELLLIETIASPGRSRIRFGNK